MKYLCQYCGIEYDSVQSYIHCRGCSADLYESLLAKDAKVYPESINTCKTCKTGILVKTGFAESWTVYCRDCGAVAASGMD